MQMVGAAAVVTKYRPLKKIANVHDDSGYLEIPSLEAQPEDFVIASGISHSIEEFVAIAFAEVGLDWRDHVVLNPTFLRPLDITFSSASPAKAERLLGWKATKKMRDVD